jgi:tripartite-type tricarboxylate transporter receptor subunit TctC
MTSTLKRRTLALAGAALLAAMAWPAAAQKFPDKPVTLYVGFAPGGAADTVARVLADEMGKNLGQRVVVENRAGASGNLATQAALNNPADGYSLIFAAIHFATNPAIGGVKYDPQKDLTMVSQITSVPVVMVASTQSGIKTPEDVMAAARKTAGGVRVGSGGVATSSHLAMELFKREMKIPMLHIPYKGGAPANQDLMGGQIDMMFDLMSGSLKSMIDAGRITPIAVMQASRVPALPNVRSAEEWKLPRATHIRSWQGIAVKGGTPGAVVTRLHEAVTAAAQSDAFRARIAQLGSEVVLSGKPEDFQAFYLRELTRWTALVKAANITVE